MTVPRCILGEGFIIDVRESTGHLEGSRLNWTMRGEMEVEKRGGERRERKLRGPSTRREHIGTN